MVKCPFDPAWEKIVKFNLRRSLQNTFFWCILGKITTKNVCQCWSMRRRCRSRVDRHQGAGNHHSECLQAITKQTGTSLTTRCLSPCHVWWQLQLLAHRLGVQDHQLRWQSPWQNGPPPLKLCFCLTQRNPTRSFPGAGTLRPTQTRPSPKSSGKSHSLYGAPLIIQLTKGKPVWRWNFHKANWTDFVADINNAAKTLPVPTVSNINEAYEAYCKILQDATKKHIPQEVRKNNVPCWDKECDDFLRTHNEAKSNTERARADTDLMTRLNTKRRERWTETVESIDFTHSSWRAWQTINKLTGQASKPMPCPITASAIAAQLINNGRFPDMDKAFTRKISGELEDLSRVPSDDTNLLGDFTSGEIKMAIKHLKPNKEARIDNIHPEYILHQGSKAKEWLRLFYSVCYQTSKLLKIWRQAKIITIPKPGKPIDDPKGYCPISLLCVLYKIMEWLLHACLDPVIDPKLPKEQAGFLYRKSMADQMTLLTQDIEDTFQRGEKAGIVLLEQTAAYDTQAPADHPRPTHGGLHHGNAEQL